jgi:hypothetical protein
VLGIGDIQIVGDIEDVRNERPFDHVALQTQVEKREWSRMRERARWHDEQGAETA